MIMMMMMMRCSFVRTAVRCPVVPDWPYQTVDTHNNTYNTTVTFWCDVGYVLFDGTTARTVKCLADGTWSADVPPCDRMCVFSLSSCAFSIIIIIIIVIVSLEPPGVFHG